MVTYARAEQISIYEDRVKHVKGFRDFLADFNTSLMANNAAPRQPITAEVIQVVDMETSMDPVTEVAEVQRMLNVNNQAILDGTAPPGTKPYKIKRSVFYTGYLLQSSDTEKLRSLVTLPNNCPDHEVKSLANNILITPRPAPKSILDKVGGIGAKMWWKVTGLGVFENRVWAARVAPVDKGRVYYTENHTPCVVLATRRQAKPIEATRIVNWQPVSEDKAHVFETTVGEKVLLRIEEEVAGEDDYEASFPNARNARKHPREEDFPPLGTQRPAGDKNRPQQRNFSGNAHSRGGGGIGYASQRGSSNTGGHGGRRGGPQQSGFRGSSRGGRGNRGGGNRGRGAYRSLDDSTGQGYGGGSMQY